MSIWKILLAVFVISSSTLQANETGDRPLNNKIVLPLEIRRPDGEKNSAFIVMPGYMSDNFFPQSNLIDRLLKRAFQDSSSKLGAIDTYLRESIHQELKNYYLSTGQISGSTSEEKYLERVVWAENTGYVLITGFDNFSDKRVLMRFESPLGDQPLTMQPYLTKLGIDSRQFDPKTTENDRVYNSPTYLVGEQAGGEMKFLEPTQKEEKSITMRTRGAFGSIINVFHKPGKTDYLPLAFALSEVFGLSKFSGLTLNAPPSDPEVVKVYTSLLKFLRTNQWFPESFHQQIADANESINWQRFGVEFSEMYTEAHSDSAKKFQEKLGVEFFAELPLLSHDTGEVVDEKVRVHIGRIARQQYVTQTNAVMRSRPGAELLAKTRFKISPDRFLILGANCSTMDSVHQIGRIHAPK
jgi:hypothetical protein